MNTMIKLSEATGLAMHAVWALAQDGSGNPVKLGALAARLNASEAHLAKVMNRLAQNRVVDSKRGPAGGFVLAARAARMSLLDVYELFEGPAGQETCLLGLPHCPLGGCFLGEAVGKASDLIRTELKKRKLVKNQKGATP